MALQLAAGTLAAQGRAVDTLFPARPVGYVTDVAGVVDPATRDSIERLAERLRGATGAELAVVTLPTIGDRDAAEVALAIGRRWGVGAKSEIGDATRNAGVVVLLVPRREGDPNSGHIRIEVGNGLEGIVTDATAGRIRDLMTPQLARGEYGGGLLTGTRALASVIARGFGVSDSALTAYRPPTGGRGRQGFPGGLLLLLLLFFVIMAMSGGGGGRGGRRRRRRVYWGAGPWIGGGWGGGGGFGGGGFGGGGFGGFGGGGGFSGGGAGGRF